MWIYDFDGVLLDSLDEVAVSAFNAVTGKMAKSIADLPQAAVRLFKRNRFHFQPAGDVIPLMQWALDARHENPDKLLTRDAFLNLVEQTAEPLIRRTERFYAARNRFAELDSRNWLALNRPFQPVWDALARRGAEHAVILTNKNRLAVYRQCHSFGLQVPMENIYAGDGGTSKTANLQLLLQRFSQRPLHFIDDSLRNLQDLDADFNSRLRTLCLYLASWGFIGPEDIEAARASGYQVLTQRQLIARLPKETEHHR